MWMGCDALGDGLVLMVMVSVELMAMGVVLMAMGCGLWCSRCGHASISVPGKHEGRSAIVSL